MSIKEALRKASWTAKVMTRTLYDAGCVKEMTFAGLKTAATILARDRKPSPTAVVDLHAANHPHREALIDKYRRLTYRQVLEETNRLADALWRRGLRGGDPLGVMLRNRAEFLIVTNAAARIGAPIVYLSYRFKSDEAAYILENSGARALFFEADLVKIARDMKERLPGLSVTFSADPTIDFPSYTDLLKEGDPLAPPPKGSKDPKLFVYTSGTTGKPKGAARKLGLSAIAPTLSFLHALGLLSTDRHLVVCPLYHSAGSAFSVFTLMLGGTIVLLEHFDAEEVLATIQREKITTSLMVPTMYSRLVDLPEETFKRYDISSLRRLVSGAALLPVPLQLQIAKRFGPVLCDFYGSTETGWNTLALPEDLARKPGTIGRVIEGNEIKLLSEELREVAVGEVGQLFVRSPLVMDGYHANDEATRASMHQGFFSVGDLAYQDKDGYYFLAGRKTDMVISGGVNIYPKEIEDILHRHPGIADIAVVGAPHATWGEILRAFVVLREGVSATAEELQAFCKEQLADFKCPREFYFVEELPRNPTGKILKKDLKAWSPETPWPWGKGSNAAV